LAGITNQVPLWHDVSAERKAGLARSGRHAADVEAISKARLHRFGKWTALQRKLCIRENRPPFPTSAPAIAR